MKEIKFKVRDKKTNQLADVILLNFNNKEITVIFDSNITSLQTQEIWYFDDCDLLQYTGLKDIKDNEIYCGDIIKDPCGCAWEVIDDRYGYDYKNNLIYAPICSRWLVDFKSFSIDKDGKEISGKQEETIFLSDINFNSEIIGNIYENPELMEDKLDEAKD